MTGRRRFVNATLIDGTGARPRLDTSIVVEDGRISAIAAGAGEARDGDDVVDLNGHYLLPGLWEVHAHLGDLLPDPHNLLETEGLIDYAIRAGRNAMDALRSGITGIRTVGEDGFVDVAWKRAFEQGLMVGPRLFVATKGISITGGHGHGTLGALEVDGPFEMRKAVRDNLKNGADLIKLMVTGGVMTAGESMAESQFLLDEIQAATEIAHQKGKRVAAHAWGAAGIKTAILGGVDSIEHGLLDDETVALMLEHDTFWVPTICATQDDEFIETGMPDFQQRKARAAATAHLEGFRKALEAGVKMACGSDTPPSSDFTLRELEFMVRSGMQPMDAIVAATATSADLCQAGDEMGTLETGRLADMIVVAENPLEDISRLRRVERVYKAGQLVDTDNSEGLASYTAIFH